MENFVNSVLCLQIFSSYKECKEKPRILALCETIINHLQQPEKLEKALHYIENVYNCETETASDIVSVLRYCTQPKEIFLNFKCKNKTVLDKVLVDEILSLNQFLKDHNYNPYELYDDFEEDTEILEELKSVPDPKEDPIRIINEFLDILHSLGDYGLKSLCR